MSRFMIEEESGTFTGRVRAHNGYWAGDFSTANNSAYLNAWFEWGRTHADSWNPPTSSAPLGG